MKRKSITFLAAILLGGTLSSLSAQVTIGSETEPQSFSVLELISNSTRGLRLPQLTQVQRDALEASDDFVAEKTGKAMGLQIFNTTTRCVETWNGTKWISSCHMCGDAPCVPPAAPAASTYFVCDGSSATVADLSAIADPDHI